MDLFMFGWSHEDGGVVAEGRYKKMCFCVRSDASAMSLLKIPSARISVIVLVRLVLGAVGGPKITV